MSVQRRKLSYWSIEFASGDEHHFDSQLFCRFLNYVDNLSEEDKLFRDEKNNKVLYKKPLTLYQGLHIQFSHSLFSEVFLLLLIFFYLFLKGIGISPLASGAVLFVEIYLTLNILLSILRGIANLYFSFYNTQKEK